MGSNKSQRGESLSLLEEFVAQINANLFLREFAISSSLIEIPDQGEVEVADHLVLLKPYTLIFQLKERHGAAAHDLPAVEKWFQRKVRRKAVTQLQSTLQYLSDQTGRKLKNDRGHEVELYDPPREALSALVIYRVDAPEGFQATKGYRSRRAGFVHFMDAGDYFNVCDLFATPVEVMDYLRHREQLINKYPDQVAGLREAALVGHFLTERPGPPEPWCSRVLAGLEEERSRWDIRFLTENLGRQIAYRKGTDESETSHYSILAELAKLSRTELGAFKERLSRALDAVREDRFVAPYRFAIPRTDCGFLIFAATTEMHEHLERGLLNLSTGSKYSFEATRHVGLAVARRDGYIDLLWTFIEAPHEPDEEVARLLKESDPFRPVKEKLVPRYNVRSDALRPPEDTE